MIDPPKTVEDQAPSAVQDIANAPGVPAPADIAARFAALERQFRHDNTISPLAPQPHEPVAVAATTGSAIRLDRAVLFYSTDGSLPSLSSPQIPLEIADVTWDYRIGYLTHWRAVVPPESAGAIVRYRIGGWRSGEASPHPDSPDVWAQDGQGFWFKFSGEEGITTFAYRVMPPRSPMPAWMDEAVIYHIFLDRFHPGTPDGVFHGDLSPRGIHGGTLTGVYQALPYLSDLGVNCIWLSPIHPAETHHRYDTKDYFAVDPILGTDDGFRQLVREAHARGIRVLMDFVPSHASWHHPAFLAAQRDPDAPTRSWFSFEHWPDKYRNFLQVSKYLPSFNTDDPGARAHLIESAVYWISEFGVDGFRLDHAIAPSMDFWTAFIAAVEAANPDTVTIGEATDTPDALRRYRGKLHGILDFELSAILRLTFGRGAWTVGLLDYLISSYDRFMAAGPGRVSFLDNHDMDRFLWVAGDDVRRLKAAALCQFTLSPTPAIYYGTEIGMTQQHGAKSAGFGGDAEARRDMPWDESLWNQDLRAFYRRLIAFRKDNAWLSHATRTTVHLDEQANSWAYLCSAPEPGIPDLLVAFDLSESSSSIELPAKVVLSGVKVCLHTGSQPDVSGSRIMLPAMSGVALRLG